MRKEFKIFATHNQLIATNGIMTEVKSLPISNYFKYELNFPIKRLAEWIKIHNSNIFCLQRLI